MGTHKSWRNLLSQTKSSKEEPSMKRLISIVLTVVIMLSFAAVGMAQTDNHNVVITVNSISLLAVSGGDVNLTVSTATPGSDLDAATDNSTTLLWTTNQNGRKVTVALNTAYSAGITLEVQASGISGFGSNTGTALGNITIGTTASDVINTISRTFAHCTLTYTATASVSAGNIASESRQVTYTITNS